MTILGIELHPSTKGSAMKLVSVFLLTAALTTSALASVTAPDSGHHIVKVRIELISASGGDEAQPAIPTIRMLFSDLGVGRYRSSSSIAYPVCSEQGCSSETVDYGTSAAVVSVVHGQRAQIAVNFSHSDDPKEDRNFTVESGNNAFVLPDEEGTSVSLRDIDLGVGESKVYKFDATRDVRVTLDAIEAY